MSEDLSNDTGDGELSNVVAITAAPVKRGPGRPRKIESAPQVDDLAHHAATIEAKFHFLEVDELVLALKGREDARDVLRTILISLAREAASLEFQRIELEKRGRDTGQISSRRIDALKKIAEIELKLRELDIENVNLSSEQMQKVFAFWVESTLEVAREVMPPELVDVFASRLAVRFKDFEEQVENRLR